MEMTSLHMDDVISSLDYARSLVAWNTGRQDAWTEAARHRSLQAAAVACLPLQQHLGLCPQLGWVRRRKTSRLDRSGMPQVLAGCSRCLCGRAAPSAKGLDPAAILTGS